MDVSQVAGLMLACTQGLLRAEKCQHNVVVLLHGKYTWQDKTGWD